MGRYGSQYDYVIHITLIPTSLCVTNYKLSLVHACENYDRVRAKPRPAEVVYTQHIDSFTDFNCCQRKPDEYTTGCECERELYSISQQVCGDYDQ